MFFCLILCYGVILMLEAFFGAVFLGLVLLGVVSAAYMIMFKMLMPKSKYEYYIIIKSDLCRNEITEAAYAAKMKLNLLGDGEFGKILVVDTGMTESERLNCLNICRKTNGIFLVDENELKEIIK